MNVRLKCPAVLNWSLLSAGLPFLRDVHVEGCPDARLEVSLRYRGVQLAFGAHDGNSFDVFDLSWRCENCVLFEDDISLVEAELVLRVSGSALPARELQPLAVPTLSPRNVELGLRRDATGKVTWLEQYPYRVIVIDDVGVREVREMQLPLGSMDLQRVRRALAALCLPQHPAVEELASVVVARLRETFGTGDVVSLIESALGRERLLEALFAALRMRITYDIEAVSFGDWNQRIRTPHKLLASMGAPGSVRASFTCIDLALIFAAVLERWGLCPLIILAANPGQSLHAVPALGRPNGVGHSQQDATHGIVDVDALPVDLTQADYRAATEGARSYLTNAQFRSVLDVSEARQAGCQPLPLHLPPRLPADAIFAETYAGQAARDIRDQADFERVGPGDVFVPIRARGRGSRSDELDPVAYLGVGRPGTKTAVLANAGAGKSYLLARAFLARLERYSESRGAARIPILYPLRKLDPQEPIGQQLLRWLCSYGFPRIPQAEFDARLARGEFTVFLDAVDEIRLRVGAEPAELLALLRPLLELPQLEVVLSARTGVFGAKAGSFLQGYQVLDLLPWTMASWFAFLDCYVEHGHLSRAEATSLHGIPSNVQSLVTRPLYCKMIVELRGHVLEAGIRNEADLFRAYVAAFWRRRPIATEFLEVEERQVCMQDIAFRMELDHRTVLSVAELADHLNRGRPDLASPGDWRKYLTDIRVYSFLDTSVSPAGEDEFSFSHEAFREFFLAEHVVEALCMGQAELLGALRLSQEVVKMMVGLLKLKENFRVQPAWLRGDRRSRRLRNVVLLEIMRSGRCPADWELDGVDLSNLNLAKVDFSRCQLSGAGFANSDLSGCTFDDAQLLQATFEYSTVDSASFRGASIEREQLEQAEGRASFD